MPEPLSSAADAYDTAYAFGALYAHVLQSTVTNEKIQIAPLGGSDWQRSQWVISALSGLIPRPFELTDGSWLLAAQTVGVRESQADGQLWLTTLRYTYQWQSQSEDNSWKVRWCYQREHPDGTVVPRDARAHVHFHGAPDGYRGTTDFHKLHLPAGRIAIEDLVHFLVTEGKCPTISHRYEEVIDEARAIFAKIQARGR